MDQINKDTFYQLVRAGFKTEGKNSRSGRLFLCLLSTRLFGKNGLICEFPIDPSWAKICEKSLDSEEATNPIIFASMIVVLYLMSGLIPLSLKALKFTLLIRRLSLAVGGHGGPTTRTLRWGSGASDAASAASSRQPRIRLKLKMKIRIEKKLVLWCNII